MSAALFDLLETSFPGISRRKRAGPKLGPPWEVTSKPFLRFDGDLPIAHAGVLEFECIVMGQAMKIAGVHAVCTRPEYRRRGYFREVMTEVLCYCDQRYETSLLTTGQPELYTPFGFREVVEYRFKTQWTSTVRADAGFRELDLLDAGDFALMDRLLEVREPVSSIFGVVREKDVFDFNESHRTLRYAADLDAVVCCTIEGTTLRLFDVVTPHMPSLAEIAARLADRIERVEIYFAPERLAVNAEAEAHIFDSDSRLMVRGPFAAESEEFMVPRAARC